MEYNIGERRHTAKGGEDNLKRRVRLPQWNIGEGGEDNLIRRVRLPQWNIGEGRS